MNDVIPPRRVPFEGVQNFRDLGGYRSGLGGQTRWGMVYRSDRLDRMTDDDLVRFRQLGIKTVFDLRRNEEREAAPDRVDNTHVCIVSAIERGGGELQSIEGLQQHDEAEAALRNMYDGILAHAGPDIGRVLTACADDERLPVVIHCTAGKDRTGVIAALLLEWLDVDRNTILDDFELTNRYRNSEHQADTFDRLVDGGMAPEAAAAMFDAPRWAMAGMLEDLDKQFGGIERYLSERALLDEATMRALRTRLLDRS